VVKPAAKRRVVQFWIKTGLLSERHGDRLMKVSRSTVRYQHYGRDDAGLRARLKVLAEKYPRYGYPTLHMMLRTEGLVANHKRTYRIYAEEGLQVRTKKRKKLTRPRMPMMLPTKADERWSIDFVSDQLANERRFRVLNIVDDFTRECVGQLIDTSISGVRMTRFMDTLGRRAKTIVCDNGPELTSKAMFFWSRERSIKLQFIQPGKPTQNAFVESFNGKFREYCLNLHWFRSLEEAKDTINEWRQHYNKVRPHSSLGKLTPRQFAEQAA
jgi:putative transposase